MEITLPSAEQNPGYHSITGAIGRCITCWARVEDELGNVFTHMTRADEDVGQHYASRRIFYSVRSFEARLDVLAAAMQGPPLLSEQIKVEWTPLLNKLREKGKKRNEIAHCAIVEIEGAPEAKSHFADPYCSYTSKLDKNRENLISEKQLLERAQGFIRLASRVALFQERLALHLGRQQTSALLFAFPQLRDGNQTSPIHSEPPKPPEASDP